MTGPLLGLLGLAVGVLLFVITRQALKSGKNRLTTQVAAFVVSACVIVAMFAIAGFEPWLLAGFLLGGAAIPAVFDAAGGLRRSSRS